MKQQKIKTYTKVVLLQSESAFELCFCICSGINLLHEVAFVFVSIFTLIANVCRYCREVLLWELYQLKNLVFFYVYYISLFFIFIFRLFTAILSLMYIEEISTIVHCAVFLICQKPRLNHCLNMKFGAFYPRPFFLPVFLPARIVCIRFARTSTK